MCPGSQPEEECPPASERAAPSQVWAASGGSYYFQNSLMKQRTERRGREARSGLCPSPLSLSSSGLLGGLGTEGGGAGSAGSARRGANLPVMPRRVSVLRTPCLPVAPGPRPPMGVEAPPHRCDPVGWLASPCWCEACL